MREWSEVPGIRLIQGDCLDVMPTLESGSVDLILSDLPYGTTACKWDTVIPFGPLWACFKHVLKPKGAVVLTASQPFTSMLVMSNREWFKYETIWRKSRTTGFLDSKFRPLKSHENILIFSPAGCSNGSNPPMTFRPQAENGKAYSNSRRNQSLAVGSIARSVVMRTSTVDRVERCPVSVVDFSSDVGLHPTQKPVALFEYLVRTYSNEGETVLDATVGSGTTPIAALNTGRRCIASEKDPGYFDIACRRVADAAAKTPLFV